MAHKSIVPPLPETSLAAGEVQTLSEFLDFYRAVLLRKTHGLTDDQLAVSVAPSDLTLGGLLAHMALVEDHWFHCRFAGHDEPEPWVSAPWDADRDWEFHIACEWSRDKLVAQFEQSLARSRSVLAQARSLDAMSVFGEAEHGPFSLRWICVHMIEEYARHCGHADYLRQAIDGQTGD